MRASSDHGALSVAGAAALSDETFSLRDSKVSLVFFAKCHSLTFILLRFF